MEAVYIGLGIMFALLGFGGMIYLIFLGASLFGEEKEEKEEKDE